MHDRIAPPGWRSDAGAIELVDESGRTFDDVARGYPHIHDYAGTFAPSTLVGLIVAAQPTALFAAAGGTADLHAHCAVVVRGLLYIAIGNRVACVRPQPYELRWSSVVDDATCFGVHYDAAHDALISHGELQIARLDDTGRIVWSASGADIFTGAFRLASDAVEATDFDGRIHRFDYADGSPLGH